jgi:hypothetical protein
MAVSSPGALASGMKFNRYNERTKDFSQTTSHTFIVPRAALIFGDDAR